MTLRRAQREGERREPEPRLPLIVGLAAAAGFVIGFFCGGGQAAGQIACGDRARIQARMLDEYGEQKVAEALTTGGAVLELLLSPEGTYTLLATPPGGPTCIAGTGESWQFVRPAARTRPEGGS